MMAEWGVDFRGVPGVLYSFDTDGYNGYDSFYFDAYGDYAYNGGYDLLDWAV
ncbi:hypothetical protein J2T22_000044 [Pseudarthrobacter defluvii]|uniref:Uncharacterized protein n=1 Tax=Pseudarthrobacter defluvii TaxID=410837 RepID=A0ABT9UB66_9MICC|nr:hypothetical protein [Pseudarthrobacter defluvii]MDQ0116882.1 hypothetical protein [Pseudarthrobacter defluvii]MDQ0116884.1 hypothetical protein [Pseudarthrobacter defluvii]